MFDKITIIGAGNMGSAIGRGLLLHSVSKVTMANRSEGRLQRFTNEFPDILSESRSLTCTTDLVKAVEGAELIVLAVKPWAIEEVINAIKPYIRYDAVVVSVAAGIGLQRLEEMLEDIRGGIIYMIPNTAIQVGKGTTFAACQGVLDAAKNELLRLFEPMTSLYFIDESKMGAATALCSCGIAYVYKFIAAAAQAGVELGFGYDDAVKYFNETVAGAAEMIASSDLTLQQQINAVTTPGGMTIRGINALERNGFTAAVIDSIIQPLKKS